MNNHYDGESFETTNSRPYREDTLYGESLYSPLHFFHVTYSKFTKLWYVKEIHGPTYSVHTSQEGALREAKELADFGGNGQVILHHQNGTLEIVKNL